jgi:transcriptional regulator with XRE-family HTH domain
VTVGHELRQRLHAELGRTGWTQARLSRKSGVSRAAISHLLCGDRDGRIATWQKLFDTLEGIMDNDSRMPLR